MDAMRTCAIVACLLPLPAAAQILCALGAGASAYKSSADQRPSADAMELASRVNAAARTVCGSNCPQVVVFRNATASNLMLIADAGRAKIVYAPQVFTAIYDRYGDAGIVALVAHALGHALDDAIGAAWIEKSWTPELRADAWAGCILARDRPTPANVQAAMAALAEFPSPSHPNWNLRLPVIRSGYGHCSASQRSPEYPVR
jgi:hypothetical protein